MKTQLTTLYETKRLLSLLHEHSIAYNLHYIATPGAGDVWTFEYNPAKLVDTLVNARES